MMYSSSDMLHNKQMDRLTDGKVIEVGAPTKNFFEMLVTVFLKFLRALKLNKVNAEKKCYF